MIFSAYRLPPAFLSLIRKILLPAPSPSSLTTRYLMAEKLGVFDTLAIRSLVQSVSDEAGSGGQGRRAVRTRPGLTRRSGAVGPRRRGRRWGGSCPCPPPRRPSRRGSRACAP